METHRRKKRCRQYGIWLVLTLFLLSGYLSTNAFAATMEHLLEQPSAQIAAPPVLLQGGNAVTSTVSTNGTSAAVNATALQTLYAHQETTVIGGSTYNLSKLVSADASGTTLLAGAGSAGRKLMGQFVYQLTGVASIPASTWTVYYRAQRDQSGGVAGYCQVDLLIRMSNDTVRSTLATGVASSGPLQVSFSTLSGTYSWAGYTVVQQTDFLEIDYYINVTSGRSGKLVYLRIDDSTLALVDQTRAAGVYLPNTYDYVLGVNNTATSSWQVRLKRYSDLNIGRLLNCTIYFHNSTGGGISSQIVIQNGTYTTQTGTWYDMGSSATIYIAMTVQANSTGTSYIYTYLEVLTPGTTTYAQYVITFQVST